MAARENTAVQPYLSKPESDLEQEEAPKQVWELEYNVKCLNG